MKKIPFIISLVLLLSILNSCNLNNLDFNKLSSELNLNPGLVAPVAKANVSVWDLIQSANKGNQNAITKDPNGLIKIIYKQNDLFSYNVRDFLKFPGSQNFTSGDKVLGNISPDNVSVSKNITLNDMVGMMNGTMDGLIALNGKTMPFPAISVAGLSSPFNFTPVTDFTSITLSNGMLEIVFENNMKMPLSVTGKLFDVGNNKKIADYSFTNIAPGKSAKTSTNIAGMTLSNQIDSRMESFTTPGSGAPVLINLADYFKMTFNLTNLGISQGNLMIKNPLTVSGSPGQPFAFDFPNEPSLKAFGAVLKSGSILVKSTNKSNLTGSVNFTLNEVKKNGTPVKASIPLNGTATTIDLAGAVINFATDPLVPYNRIPYTYSLTVNATNGFVAFSSTDLIRMDVTLSNLQFQSISGDFGKRTIQIDPGVFNLNVDMLDKINGTFTLANPQLALIIRNSIGMPASVNLNFNASNKDGKTAALNPPVFDIPVPASLTSGIATKSVVFDKTNSNIVNFIALPPTSKVSYSGKADFNQSALAVTPQNPNFLDVDATFAIDMSMELPMQLQIANLAFRDTSSITGSDYKKLESADLIVNATNEIPLNVDLQLIFIDQAKKQIGVSQKSTILKAGDKAAASVSEKIFSLTQSDMINLRKANAIVFVGTVSSPSDGAGVATILADSKLDLNVVIKAKVNP